MAWTREEAAHLLQRAGFGGSLGDVDQTFALVDLVSVSWVKGVSAHQFDNIVITSDVVPAPAPAPAPAAWLGVVAGLVLLGIARRPRR